MAVEPGGLRSVLESGSDQGLRKAGGTGAGVAAVIKAKLMEVAATTSRLQIPVYHPSKDVIMMSCHVRQGGSTTNIHAMYRLRALHLLLSSPRLNQFHGGERSGSALFSWLH